MDRTWVRILATLLVSGASVALVTSWHSADDIVGWFLVTNLGAWTIADSILRGGTARASRLVPTPTIPRELLWGILAALLPLMTLTGIALSMGAVWHLEHMQVFYPTLMFLVPMAALEELMFRGVIFDALRGRFGDAVAIAITSAVFAMAHGLNPGASPLALVNVGLAGVLLAVMIVRTGSLWPSIAFHITWNSVLSEVLRTPVSGNTFAQHPVLDLAPLLSRHPVLGPLLFGSGFGLEEGLLTTVTLVLATGLVVQRARISPFVTSAVFRMKYLRSTS